MSFILEALRKSESERQRDAGPTVTRLAGAVEAPRLPAWAAGAIALLALGLLGIAAAWWLSARLPGIAGAHGRAHVSASTLPARRGPGSIRSEKTSQGVSAGPGSFASRAAPASLDRNAGEPAPRKNEAPDDAGQASDLAPNGSHTGRGAVRDTALTGASIEAEAAAAGARVIGAGSKTRAPSAQASGVSGEPRTPSAQASGFSGQTAHGGAADASRAHPASTDKRLKPSQLPPVAEFLPNYTDAAASNPSMPMLVLQLHAYYADPARRFVFINGEKYVQGQTLKEGPLLVRITPGGAVLSLHGRQFLLPRN